MNKTFKVRIEDTESGEVEEFESNCLSVISVDEKEEKEDSFPTKAFSYGNCTHKMILALIKALDLEKTRMKERLFNRMISYVTQKEDDE